MFGALLGAINPVAAIGSALSIGESALAYKGQKDANESNERIAQENRAFQERMVDQAQEFEKKMSNTAYQRAMADMKKAGLNPILAYKQGGASTPIGKTAPGSTAVMQNPFGGMQGSVMQGISTASSIMSQRQQRENLKSQLENDIAYRELTWAQRQVAYETAQKINEEIELVEANTAGVEAENVSREIVADFFGSNEWAKIAQSIPGGSVAANAIKAILQRVLMRK